MRVRTLTLDELVSRLGDQLSLVNLSARTAPVRHRTLESALDWSHELLNDAERVLWRRLSVFAGGFTLASAESVCADDLLPTPEVFDAMTGLGEKSIVVADREPSGRHRLLEPLRLYGRARLRATGEECEFLNRHREWCSELAVGVDRPLVDRREPGRLDGTGDGRAGEPSRSARVLHRRRPRRRGRGGAQARIRRLASLGGERLVFGARARRRPVAREVAARFAGTCASPVRGGLRGERSGRPRLGGATDRRVPADRSWEAYVGARARAGSLCPRTGRVRTRRARGGA